MSVCLYSYLSYPAYQSRFSAPYYIAICHLSISTIFFHIISKTTRFWEEKLLNIKLCFNFMNSSCLKRIIQRDIIINDKDRHV